MPRKLSLTLTLVSLAALTLVLTATNSFAQTETVLYGFAATPKDADVSVASLVFDKAGNLYGTTYGGGAFSQGAVFQLSPLAGGGWRERVVHSFNKTGTGGYFPLAGLVMDSAGNLYGTTFEGGTHNAGTVFELLPQINGTWSGKVLHEFGDSADDGIHPEAGLVFDNSGNLYGTTYNGGAHLGGTTFELSPMAGGLWKQKVLHAFNSGPNDGESPIGTLTFDPAGNVYGTTVNGGTSRYGTVYELTPTSTGPWTESLIHSFSNSSTDGGVPEANVTFDSAGNLYGTTAGGGVNNAGTVFKLSPAGGGSWILTVLYSFVTNSSDGTTPTAGVVFDASGNLYGTTDNGGAFAAGTVYKLTPSGGTWTETIVHSFGATSTDGSTPAANLIFDASGTLYGTASQGGAHNGGVAFEITP